MIETSRLQLIPCEWIHFEAILENNPVKLSALLHAHVLEDWKEFPEVFESAAEKIRFQPDLLNWWVYLAIFKPESVLIGSCGFKGKPDEHGVVEIGYEIHPDFRNKGLATELAGGLIQFAFSKEIVKKVIAHTIEEENASVRVLKKNGMNYATSFSDPQDGWVWQWEINR